MCDNSSINKKLISRNSHYIATYFVYFCSTSKKLFQTNPQQNQPHLQRWSSLQNTRSRGRGWIQIQLLPPYIYLNLPVSTPWSLNTPIPTPKPTNLHPLDVDQAPPPGSLFCSEGLWHLQATHTTGGSFLIWTNRFSEWFSDSQTKPVACCVREWIVFWKNRLCEWFSDSLIKAVPLRHLLV